MKRLLWCGDAGVSSGFARATHRTLDVLKQTWDVHVLGINYHGEPDVQRQHGYDIYPCTDPHEAGTKGDFLGVQRLPRLLQKLGPDVVVVQNDPWNVPQYLRACGNVPVVGWIAVDGKNCRGSGMNGLAQATFWTRFGEEQARLGGYAGRTAVVPLGVDLETYRPLDRRAVRTHFRDLLFGPRFPVDGFIVGVVGRNQFRKRLDLAVAYFAEWVSSRGIDDAYLYLHVGPTGDESFDLFQLPQYYGIANRVIVSEPQVGHGDTEARLNEVYNIFDVLLSTSQAEGWNLPAMEAMAAGVPCVLGDWAAHSEWPRGAAVLVPCPTTACTPNGINVVCGVPGRDETIAALDALYRSRELRADLSAKGSALVAQPQYRWRAVGEAFRDSLEDALTHRSRPEAITQAAAEAVG